MAKVAVSNTFNAATPIGKAIQDAMTTYAGSMPDASDNATVAYKNSQTMLNRQKLGAAQKIEDAVRAAYGPQDVISEGPMPEGEMGPGAPVHTQRPRDVMAQEQLPAVFGALMAGEKPGDIGSVVRAMMMNAPGMENQTVMDRSMMGAGDPYTDTISGFREAEKGKMARTQVSASKSSGGAGGQGKPPQGYIWGPNDPKTGKPTLEPIAGGPRTQISSELSARLGIAKVFLGEYKDLRSKLQGGEVSGLKGKAQLAGRMGEPGQVKRRIETGVDALRRMLTGAGMPAAEAADYVMRYQPELTDGPQTLVNKLDGLAKDLQGTVAESTRGRVTNEERDSAAALSQLDDLPAEEEGNGSGGLERKEIGGVTYVRPVGGGPDDWEEE